jgi:hypothetical protein
VVNAVESLGKRLEASVDKTLVDWRGSCEEPPVKDVDESR